MIKYKKEIRDCFIKALDLEGSLFDEGEIDLIIDEAIEENNETYQTLSDKIDVGIKNGYSAQKQFDILENYLERMNTND